VVTLASASRRRGVNRSRNRAGFGPTLPSVPRYVAPVSDDELLQPLKTGPLHPFADFREIEDLPRTGAGVYTIWDDSGQLVYVGIAGRNIAGKGLRGRLSSHHSGRRSGDQFCVYVSDRYVLLDLTEEERIAIGAGELSMDEKIRDYVRTHLAFRYVEVGDYTTAMRVENAVKAGTLGRAPHLNPQPPLQRLAQRHSSGVATTYARDDGAGLSALEVTTPHEIEPRSGWREWRRRSRRPLGRLILGRGCR
jgi:hypothetical protein